MHTVRFILIAILFLTACNSTSARQSSYFEVVGNQTKRVSTVSAMLTKFHEPPTLLIDAQFVEEKIGDDELGPADYRTFAMIVVAPQDLAQWQAILTPLDNPPEYQAPPQTYTWWVNEARFATLQFYAPDVLTGRANGWVAIDLENGTIYIFSFTT